MRKKGVYTVIVEESGRIIKGVEFSGDRVASHAIGLELIQVESPREIFGMELSEIQSVYGEYHSNTDSGAFFPGYITEDAHLIRIGLSDNVLGGGPCAIIQSDGTVLAVWHDM